MGRHRDDRHENACKENISVSAVLSERQDNRGLTIANGLAQNLGESEQDGFLVSR